MAEGNGGQQQAGQQTGAGAGTTPPAKQGKKGAQETEYVILRKSANGAISVDEKHVISNNGAGGARKKAFDASSKEERDKGITLAAIPTRSFVFKTRKTKVTESSTEE
jgi:hypothetical protein